MVLDAGSLRSGCPWGWGVVKASSKLQIADSLLYPHVVEREELPLWTLLIRELIPFMRAPSTSMTQLPSKGPQLQTSSHSGLDVDIRMLGGEHNHSGHSNSHGSGH